MNPAMNPDPLAQLRGYHLPSPVSWWPPAPGWWLLALLALIALAAIIWLLLRLRHRKAARRSAQRELQALKSAHAADGDDSALIQGLSRLLRRFALARFPRQQVAGLTGEEWLQFLDRHTSDQAFTQGVGRALVAAPYSPHAGIHSAELTALVERWIHSNPEAKP